MSTEYWPGAGRVSVQYRSICWPILDRHSIDTRSILDRHSADIFLLSVHLSTDSVGDVSVNYRRAIGRLSVNYRRAIFDVALQWYSKNSQLLSNALSPPTYLPIFKVFYRFFFEPISDSYSNVRKTNPNSLFLLCVFAVLHPRRIFTTSWVQNCPRWGPRARQAVKSKAESAKRTHIRN